MSQVDFRIMEDLLVATQKKADLYKTMSKEGADTHVIALMVYATMGGYNSVVRSLKSEIEQEPDVREYDARMLVKQANSLKEKAEYTINKLKFDDVLTLSMIDKIGKRYLTSDNYVRQIKRYLHHELGKIIRDAIYR